MIGKGLTFNDNGTVRVTRTSTFSGITRTKTLKATKDQFAAWQDGVPIQNAFPHLNPEDREFILTGTSNDEWDAAFKEEAQ